MLSYKKFSITEDEARLVIANAATNYSSYDDLIKKKYHFAMLGIAYKKLGQYQKAINAFTSALELAIESNVPSEIALAYFNRAYTYINKDDQIEFTNAISDFIALCNADPGFPDTKTLARIFLTRLFHETCQFILSETCPPLLRPILQAALIKFSAEKLKQQDQIAVELCNFYLAVSIEKNDLDLSEEAYLLKFLLLKAKSRKISTAAYDAIEKSFDNVEEFVTKFQEITNKLAQANGYAKARLLTERGLFNIKFVSFLNAIDDFDAAIDLIDDNNNFAKSIAYLNRGMAYSLTQQDDKANTDFSSALELSEDFANVSRYAEFRSKIYNARARLYIGKLNFEAACADLTKVLEVYPNSLDIADMLFKLFNTFLIECLLHSMQLGCNVELKKYILSAFNTRAATVNLSDPHARHYLEVSKFYLELLAAVLSVSVTDFNIVYERAESCNLSPVALAIIGVDVDAAIKRHKELHANQAVIAESKNDADIRYISSATEITAKNADKVIIDYTKKIKLANSPYAKLTALDIRAIAYQRLGQYHFSFNDYTDMMPLISDSQKNYRSIIYARISELYYRMDNYPKAQENLIATFKIDCGPYEKLEVMNYQRGVLKLMMQRCFFKTAELSLDPECPGGLRLEIQRLLSDMPNCISSTPAIFAELCHFYKALSMHKLSEFTDKSQTSNKVILLAIGSGLSAEALEWIKKADNVALTEKTARLLTYCKTKKPSYFVFFKGLPQATIPAPRPEAPSPQLRG